MPTPLLPRLTGPIVRKSMATRPDQATISAEDIESNEECIKKMDEDLHYHKLAYVLKASQGPSVKDFIKTIHDNNWTYRLTLTDNGYVGDDSTFKFEFKLIKSPCNQTGRMAEGASEEDLIDKHGNFTWGDTNNGFHINRQDIWSEFKTIASENKELVTQLQDINSFNELQKELQKELDPLLVNVQEADAESAETKAADAADADAETKAADEDAAVVTGKIDLSNVQLTIALLGALEAAYIEKQSVANENDIQIMVSCGISLISSIYVLYKKRDELEAGADKVIEKFNTEIENFIGKSVFLIEILGDNTQKILEAIKASCDYNYGEKSIKNAEELVRQLVVFTHIIMENNRAPAVGTGAAVVTTVTVSSNILSYIVWELIHLPVKMYRNPKKTGAVTVIGLLFVAQMYRHEIEAVAQEAAMRHLWYRLTGWLSGVAQSRFTQWLNGVEGFDDPQMCATSDDMEAMQEQLRQMTELLAQQNAQQNVQSITGQCFNDGDPRMQMITGFTKNVFQAVGEAGGQVVAGVFTAVARNPFQRIAGPGGGGKRKRTKKRKRRRRGGSKKTKRRGKKSKKGGKRRRGGSKKRNRRSQRKTKK